MNKLLPILLALLALTGCGDPCGSDQHDGDSFDGGMCQRRTHREFRVDSRVPVEQVSEMVRAGIAWGDLTNGAVKLTWVIADSNYDVSMEDFGENASILGLTFDDGSIKLSTRTLTDQIFPLMLHELGHTFGLGHEPAEGHVMSLFSSGVLTQFELDHFNRVWKASQ